jgi:Heterokaryon incompatibility protein (HET)
MLKDVEYRLAVVKPGEAFHQMLPTRFQFPRNHPNVVRLDVAVPGGWLPGEIFILPTVDTSDDISYSLDGRLLCPHWIDFSILSGWISYCQSHHGGICDPLDMTSANAGQENLRQVVRIKVIDCETRAIITAPEDCSYVALSYVWGSPSTNQSTEEETTVGVLPDNVPTTVNDAVKVVLGLKLRYLWVDKYCIDQSNETEMLLQLSNMDMVYNRAVATIVAVAGEDSDFGLPGVDRRPRARQISVNLDGQIWISSSQNPVEIIDKSKWSTRAWTYQEGVLSTRRLIFTNEQVYYECNAMAHRETVRYSLPENLDDAIEDDLTEVLRGQMRNEVEGEDGVDEEEEDEKEDEGESEWEDIEENEKDYYYKVEDNTKYRIQGVTNGGFGLHQRGLDHYIEEYSGRSLSWQSDIIKAMLGVFQVFARMPTPTRQYWGVPMDYRYNVDVHFKFVISLVDRHGHLAPSQSDFGTLQKFFLVTLMQHLPKDFAGA